MAEESTFWKIIQCFIVLAVTIGLTFAISKLGKKKILASDRYSSKNDTKDPIPFIIIQIVNIILACIAGIEILSIWGLNVTKLFAGLGIASAIVGLALQDTIKDIIMGAHLYRDKYFTTGDYIMYQGNIAKVETFSLRTTKIRLLNQSVISISNRNLDSIQMATEFTALEIPLSYEDDHNRIKKVLTDVVEELKTLPHIKDAGYMGVKEFGESAIPYVVIIRTEPQYSVKMKFDSYNLIQDRLVEAGLHIPYNQLDIHMEKPEPEKFI